MKPPNGQWRGADGRLVHEQSRVLILFHEPSAEDDERIEAIRAAYMKLHRQEAVMRVDSEARVRF